MTTNPHYEGLEVESSTLNDLLEMEDDVDECIEDDYSEEDEE